MKLRVIAGIFAGSGGLMALYLGVSSGRQELITGGLLLLSNMMTFFVGENNGERKAAKETSE